VPPCLPMRDSELLLLAHPVCSTSVGGARSTHFSLALARLVRPAAWRAAIGRESKKKAGACIRHCAQQRRDRRGELSRRAWSRNSAPRGAHGVGVGMRRASTHTAPAGSNAHRGIERTFVVVRGGSPSAFGFGRGNVCRQADVHPAGRTRPARKSKALAGRHRRGGAGRRRRRALNSPLLHEQRYRNGGPPRAGLQRSPAALHHHIVRPCGSRAARPPAHAARSRAGAVRGGGARGLCSFGRHSRIARGARAHRLRYGGSSIGSIHCRRPSRSDGATEEMRMR